MSKINLRTSKLCTKLLAGTATVFAISFAGTAFAQEQQAETVVVTGSLLPQASILTAEPVTLITNEQITNSGLTSVTDVIRSVVADNSGTIPTSFTAGFAAGSGGVALRGLTVNSTLVLVDGRRTSNYPLADDGERGFVDLNTIPLDAVDHVEVLKDGASSIYGADAIAGVVNIILKDSYQGVGGELEVGTSEGGGGMMERATVTAGWGNLDTDRFNGFVNLEYERDASIRVDQRNFPFDTSDLTPIGGDNNTNTSSIYGTFRQIPFTVGNSPLHEAATGLGPFVLFSGGCGPKGVADSSGDLGVAGTVCRQNLAPYGDDQPLQSRFGGFSRFTFKVSSITEAYMDAYYFEDQVRADGIPPGDRTTTPNNTTNLGLPAYLANGNKDPYDPFAALCPATGTEGVTPCNDAKLYYRFGDIPAYGYEDNKAFRMTFGLKGTLDGWTYDTALVAAHDALYSKLAGFLNFNQLLFDINNGTYDFYHNFDGGTNSKSVLQALAPNLIKTSTTDEDSADIRAYHDLFDLPGGASRLGLGVEARHEDTFDPDLNPGAAAQGLGSAHTIGFRNVFAAFGEFDMPVFTTWDVDVSGRYDHYSDFGSTFNPKITSKWTPIPEVAFRGTYSTGFRAPSFSENGSASATGFITETPCPTFTAFCAAHANDGYTLAYGLALATTANPNIKPETSRNWTVGTILQPFDGENFIATVDYYNIQKKNVVGPAPSGPALTAAFTGGAIPAGYSVIFDNPDPDHPGAPLRPIQVGAPYLNASSLGTTGMDSEIRASFPLSDVITWATDLTETHIFEFKFVPCADRLDPNCRYQDWVGTQAPYILSSGAGTPRDRASWANTFTWEDLSLTGTLYYTKGYREKGVDATGFASPAPSVPCLYEAGKFCTVKASWDFDLTARYHLTDKFDIFGGVRDVFGTKPPLDPADYAATNYNPTYSQDLAVGRFFSIGVSFKD